MLRAVTDCVCPHTRSPAAWTLDDSPLTSAAEPHPHRARDTSRRSATSPPSCLRREKRSFAQIISTLPVSCLAMHTPVSWLYLLTPMTTCVARGKWGQRHHADHVGNAPRWRARTRAPPARRRALQRGGTYACMCVRTHRRLPAHPPLRVPTHPSARACPPFRPPQSSRAWRAGAAWVARAAAASSAALRASRGARGGLVATAKAPRPAGSRRAGARRPGTP